MKVFEIKVKKMTSGIDNDITFLKKNGKINQRNLFNFLGVETLKVRTSSVVSPSAHFSKLCNPPDTELCHNSISQSMTLALKDISMEFYYIVIMLEYSGCRISEVFKISPKDIASNGSFILKSSKNSDNRIIFIKELQEYLLDCKMKSIYPFRSYDRYFVYRNLKKLGVGARFGNCKNYSVTHFFRHDLLLSLHNVDKSSEVSKSFIGHKSIKSTRIYATGEKK